MVSTTDYRRIVGHFATGVTVITTCDEWGIPRGFTANAFSSLSLDPPRVLVCIGVSNQTHPLLIAEGAVFGVNILAAHQEELSRLFATKHPDKFRDVEYRHGVSGAPILREVLAHLECRVSARFDSGDHTILVGDVCELSATPDQAPLIYYRGAYALLSAAEGQSSEAPLRLPSVHDAEYKGGAAGPRKIVQEREGVSDAPNVAAAVGF